jgi:hypothetical protein
LDELIDCDRNCFILLCAFDESLSFDAQKKVTKEKGILPLLLRKRKSATAQQS